MKLTPPKTKRLPLKPSATPRADPKKLARELGAEEVSAAEHRRFSAKDAVVKETPALRNIVRAAFALQGAFVEGYLEGLRAGQEARALRSREGESAMRKTKNCKTKNCPHCGSILIDEIGSYGDVGTPRQLVCHNDYCEINREGLQRRELAASIGTGLGLGCLLIKLAIVGALVVGAGYGLYLLLGR